MVVMSDTPAQTEGGKPQQAPGDLLKQAREKLGLAQKDIAAQLNLQTEVIDAVEKNDRDRLPVATYARGYIRSYARLVKMDADMLIQLYDQYSTPPPEIIPTIKKPTQASSRDKPVRAIIYLITFILALLLLAWLQSKYIVGRNPGGGTPDTTDTGEKTGQHAVPGPQNQVPGSSVAIPDSKQTHSSPQDLSHSLPESATTTRENVISETEATDQPVIDTTLPAAINPAQITENLMKGEDRLEFILNHDSWIEVYDAHKTKMYHGLARAGNEIKLAGTAPFSVLLGNVAGVTVRYNDEPFDPAPYANAGIARFTLGAQDIH
jgi:cytoskeleton protein RodZ